MPDLPGCGLSSRPNASYELQWHAQVIASWLRQCGLESVDMVGHSFGGGVAQMLLLECPERMRRIVLVAPGGLGRDVGFWLKLATFPHFVERYGQPFMAFGTRRAFGHARSERDLQDVTELSSMNATKGTARAFSRTVRDVSASRQTRLFCNGPRVEAFPPGQSFGERSSRSRSLRHALVARMKGARFHPFAASAYRTKDPAASSRVARVPRDPTAQPFDCVGGAPSASRFCARTGAPCASAAPGDACPAASSTSWMREPRAGDGDVRPPRFAMPKSYARRQGIP